MKLFMINVITLFKRKVSNCFDCVVILVNKAVCVSEVIVRVKVYLEFSSSSTSIFTIPNRLIYVCISGRFASMQSILEVSH